MRVLDGMKISSDIHGPFLWIDSHIRKKSAVLLQLGPRLTLSRLSCPPALLITIDQGTQQMWECQKACNEEEWQNRNQKSKTKKKAFSSPTIMPAWESEWSLV